MQAHIWRVLMASCNPAAITIMLANFLCNGEHIVAVIPKMQSWDYLSVTCKLCRFGKRGKWIIVGRTSWIFKSYSSCSKYFMTPCNKCEFCHERYTFCLVQQYMTFLSKCKQQRKLTSIYMWQLICWQLHHWLGEGVRLSTPVLDSQAQLIQSQR